MKRKKKPGSIKEVKNKETIARENKKMLATRRGIPKELYSFTRLGALERIKLVLKKRKKTLLTDLHKSLKTKFRSQNKHQS